MKRPIDRFAGKNADEIYEKNHLLDPENLEKGDRLAMFLAAFRVLLPGLLLVIAPFLLIAILV